MKVLLLHNNSISASFAKQRINRNNEQRIRVVPGPVARPFGPQQNPENIAGGFQFFETAHFFGLGSQPYRNPPPREIVRFDEFANP